MGVSGIAGGFTPDSEDKVIIGAVKQAVNSIRQRNGEYEEASIEEAKIFWEMKLSRKQLELQSMQTEYVRQQTEHVRQQTEYAQQQAAYAQKQVAYAQQLVEATHNLFLATLVLAAVAFIGPFLQFLNWLFPWLKIGT